MRAAAIPLLLLLAAFPAAGMADDDLKTLVQELRDQLSELKAQVKESNARINELEQKLQQEQARKQPEATVAVDAEGKPKETARPVTAGDVRGSIKLPGSATSIAFGGYAKLDVLFNSVSGGADKLGDQQLYVTDIPAGASRRGEHGQITLHAKESRLWFRSFTPSEWGDVNTLIELDLYGARDAYTPRLRHAYGSIGNFLAGQTWTTFTNMAAIPETLDIGTPVGDIIVRQPQVRWTQPFAGTPLELMLALEWPRSRVTKGTDAISAPGDERYPDLMLRLNGSYDWGSLSLAGMARQIRISEASGKDQQEWGGAASLAGRINVGRLDNLRFMLNYGNVLARYVTTDAYPDASLDAAGHMELNTVYSGMLAYQHYWTDVLRSTAALSYSHADLPAYVSSSLTREARSAHINLLWNPLPQAMFGLEYIYALRELQDGQNGDLSRLQFSSRFNF